MIPENEVISVEAGKSNDAPEKRKEYITPVLTIYGSMVRLTASGTKPPSEAGQNGKRP